MDEACHEPGCMGQLTACLVASLAFSPWSLSAFVGFVSAGEAGLSGLIVDHRVMSASKL